MEAHKKYHLMMGTIIQIFLLVLGFLFSIVNERLIAEIAKEEIKRYFFSLKNIKIFGLFVSIWNYTLLSMGS